MAIVNKHGSYFVVIRVHDKQRWFKVDGGQKAAKQYEKDLLAKRQLGQLPVQQKAQQEADEKKHLTFRAYAEQWLRDKTEAVRPGTLANYESRLRNYLLHDGIGLGDELLSETDRTRVKQFRSDMRKAFPKLTARTVNAVMVQLHGIFDEAVKDEKVDRNPAWKLTPLQENPRRGVALTFEQVDTLLRLTEDNPALHLMIWCPASLGLRMGEMLGLRWGDIDAHGTMHIRQTYRAGKFGPPKSDESRRDLPLPDDLRRLLAAYRVKQGGFSGEALIFDRGDGKPFAPGHVLRQMLRPLLREEAAIEAGLAESLRWHDLRHTFSTNLGGVAGDPKTAQVLMGHSDPSVAMNHYTQARDGAKRAALESLTEAQRAASVRQALDNRVLRTQGV